MPKTLWHRSLNARLPTNVDDFISINNISHIATKISMLLLVNWQHDVKIYQDLLNYSLYGK